MKNREIYVRDPVTEMIPNQGVATISEADSEVELETLRYELRHFVCEGQYEVGLSRILRSFLDCLSAGNPQKGIWVSGFFGSGKSHLVKVLRFLWTDFELPGGTSARGLVTGMPDEVRELFLELDSSGKRVGGIHAAAGKVGDKTRSKDDIPMAVLQVVLQSLNLPDEYQAAKLYFYLHQSGALTAVSDDLTKAGTSLSHELKNLYVSNPLREAIRKHCPDFAGIPATEMTATLRAQYPPTGGHISVTQMAEAMQAALTLNGPMPLTLLALDELQQFVGDSAARSLAVQEVVEACSNQFQAKLLLVATGQSAITETPNLNRLAGRFQIQISLTDADVETVTRSIVLGKKPDAKEAIKKMIEDNKGEIFRHLKSTAIAAKTLDDNNLIADYPILPTRRRFWERVLRAIDPTGTSTMLRTQLRLIDEAARSSAEKELGHVVPADFLFTQEKGAFQNAGALLPEELNIIERQVKEDPVNGLLKSRLCALCFLIGKLPKGGAGNIGVKANPENLADLLVEDLHNDGAKLRRIVPELLEQLASSNELVLVDGEYHIQTPEGSEWARDFEGRKKKILSDKSKIAEVRSKYIATVLESEIRAVTVFQGHAKLRRDIQLKLGQDRPKPEGGKIIVWVQDGWSVQVNEVIKEAQLAGQEDATVFVFVPLAGDDLTQAIADFEAASETLAAKAIPTSDAGRQARAAIDARRSGFEQTIKRIITGAVGSANVYLGGGSEVEIDEQLRSGIQKASDIAATRLFPKFSLGDDSKWHLVFKQAQEGAGDPLKAISFTGSAPEHPVCKAILEFAGAGKLGSEVRSKFTREPFGWSQDAIDGALLALLAGGAIVATRGSKKESVKATALDHKTIGDTSFRTEYVTISLAQRIAIRQLYLLLEITCRPNEEVNYSNSFISAAIELAKLAGGDPPLPERPNFDELLAMKDLSGNEQLLALHEQREILKDQFEQWRKTIRVIEERRPQWYELLSLLDLAQTLPDYLTYQVQVEAIRGGRQIVDSPNPIQPLCDLIANDLRKSFTEVVESFSQSYAFEFEKIKSSDAWKKIPEDKWKEIMTESNVRWVEPPDVTTTTKLIESLKKIGLAQWKSERDALPQRFGQAERIAVKLIEPSSIQFPVPRKLLRTTQDVETYVEQLKSDLIKKVQSNPVQVS